MNPNRFESFNDHVHFMQITKQVHAISDFLITLMKFNLYNVPILLEDLGHPVWTMTANKYVYQLNKTDSI